MIKTLSSCAGDGKLFSPVTEWWLLLSEAAGTGGFTVVCRLGLRLCLGAASPLRSADLGRPNFTTAPRPPPPSLHSPSCINHLLSHLHRRSSSSSAAAEYTSSLLRLISLSPHPLPALLTSLTNYIHLFTSHEIPHDRNSQVTIQLFFHHLENIPIKNLPSISDSIVSSLSNVVNQDDSHLLDLLPKCLNLICSSNEIEEPIGYVNLAIDRVLDCSWSRLSARDFVFLDKGRCRRFVAKVFDEMTKVELQDLPSLVYQLLVLASKGFS
ncbi:hypothetical protein RJ639_002734 [Escallonia herrerae]|uniref:FANCI solenoid 1 domain-containing protein n=1 Tax=Escallonia herrerae TaxID=1293975 RepID=A0AA88W164_9ASTE|nr:hypothetical protein RJ639_002734 [Escallonia herrerae]